MTPGPHYGVVVAALTYAHRMACGLDHCRWCNMNFDGKGTGLPSAWIDRVDWLED